MVKKIKRRKQRAWEIGKIIKKLYQQGRDRDISDILHHHEKVHHALGKRVFSFDLHGTLAVPTKPMEDYVLDQFLHVMRAYDINVLRDFSGMGKQLAENLGIPQEELDNAGIRMLTIHYLATTIRNDSREYKARLNKKVEEGDEELKRNKQLRMSVVNARVITETLWYDNLPPDQVAEMAIEVHQRIDSFGGEWMLAPKAGELLDHVASLTPRPAMCLLSNTNYHAAARAVRQYLSKWIAPWMVFTPDNLGGYLKPSREAFIGAIVGARCGVVREVMEGRDVDQTLTSRISEAMGGYDFSVQRWESSRTIAIERAQRSIAANNLHGFESISAGIDTFIEQMGLPSALRSALGMRYEQFHYVGNSPRHDIVPRMNVTDGSLERFYNRLLGIPGYEGMKKQ